MTLRNALIAASLFVASQAFAQSPTPNCQLGADGVSCTRIARPLGISASAVESSHVMKASPGTVTGFQVNNTNAAARWVFLLNATSAPSNGALVGCANAAPSTPPCVAKFYQIGATSTIGVSWSPGPPLFLDAGIVLMCSSTGPFTLTAAADCTFSGEIN